jgi:hypothetical protein
LARPWTITHEELKRLIHYDSETGLLTWVKARPGVVVGKEVGYLGNNGYVSIQVLGQRVLAHRLVFFYMTGEWPTNDVDHIDGCRTNNRWKNLRQATRAQNLANRSANLNRTLPKNVYLHPNGYYRVKVKMEGKFYHVGYFPDLSKASLAAIKKQKELFGEYAKEV